MLHLYTREYGILLQKKSFTTFYNLKIIMIQLKNLFSYFIKIKILLFKLKTFHLHDTKLKVLLDRKSDRNKISVLDWLIINFCLYFSVIIKKFRINIALIAMFFE